MRLKVPVMLGLRGRLRTVPVECVATPSIFACSYSPGGKVVGINESWPDMESWMRYIAMQKSVESRDPRLWVSAIFLRK